ncbi:MAG TPA: hypothetical protein VLQ48_15135 [Chloroflexia bacterium]|nr:hypothetical protein [Chloroflexia bacterium]
MANLQDANIEVPRIGLSRHTDRLLLLARVAWPIYVTLLMTIFIAGLQVHYINLSNPSPAVQAGLERMQITTAGYALYNIALEASFTIGFLGVATLIYARNQHDGMGIFTVYTLSTFGTAAAPITLTVDSLVSVAPQWALPLRLLRFLAWAMMLLLFYLFPDGRFANPRLRPLILLTILLVQIPWNMFPELPISPWQWPAPYHLAVIVACWGPALYAQFYRYGQIPNRVRKQQTKWFVYGSAVAVAGAFSIFIPRIFNPELGDAGKPESLEFQLVTAGVVYLSALILPISIGISILRYRLWDIDVIINKTLVYVPLTSILAGIFAATLKVLQTVFESVLGITGDVKVVLTTLFLVAIFTPIKDGIQKLVDRRFRGPPKPADDLKELMSEMTSFVEMNNSDRITRRVLEDLVRVFGAEGGALYLAYGEHEELEYAYGDRDEADTEGISTPLKSEGVQIGTIRLGKRKTGEEYNPRDVKLLRDTASLLAATLRANSRDSPES